MVTLKITNQAAFDRSLEALKKKIIEGVAQTLAESAEALAENAKARAPFKTGELRESISVEASEDGLLLEVIADAPHAPLVEFGTRKLPAQPFMVPAAEEEFPKIREALIKTLNRAIKN